MKEPVRIPSQAGVSTTPTRRGGRTAAPSGARSGPSAGGAPRPRRKVPGGKALARINMLLAQRGIAPEPRAPEPPAVPEITRAPAAPPGATAQPRSAAADLVAGYHAARGQLAATAPAAAPSGAGQTWRPLGPYYVPHGQSYGTGRGSRPPVAGRVAAIAVDPGDDRHVLCGAAGGGVWETRDGGRTWTPRTDGQPSVAIGALAFDPSDPRRAYAGTGEGNTAESRTQNVRAAGLLASDDGGTTWAVMPGGTFLGIAFYDLVVDPADGRHLLAATTDGLFETTDRGATWTRRRAALTWSLSMHPQVPTNPAAGREVLAGCIDGVFRSTDGGRTWAAVALPGRPASFQPERIAVDHAPSNGSVAYVFAAGTPQVVDTVATEESGVTTRMPKPYLWRRQALGGAFASVRPPGDIQTGQAWYDWFLAVAPNNPDVVYVGAINAHRGERRATGGWTWANVSAKAPEGDSIHPDQHAIAFSPADANVVYVGSDGGLFRSPDAGQRWEALNRGLCITEIEFLAQHPDYDAWLLAGTQDNGTIRYEGQQTWYHVQDGDGGDCAVDADDPYTCYHSFYGPYVEKSDGGGGWNDWRGTTPRALNEEEALFYPPLDVHGKLVVRGATRVWLSRNAGGSWKAVDLPGNAAFVSAVTAAAADRVYAGTEAGDIYRLDASGAGWRATALASPATGYVSEILADATGAGVLWCAVNSAGVGSVFRSDDGGATWAAAGTGLPAVAVHALEIDPARPDTLFAATDVGVSRTDDGGATWTAFGVGLPNVLVKDVLLHPASRLLRAGTQARGVWEISIDAAPTPDVQVYLRDHAADTGRATPSPADVPNPFARGTNLFWWQSPDVKIDASPFRVPGLDDLDFAVYADDRAKIDGSIDFAAGLTDERPIRGQTVRVYVQVHNRGRVAAQGVAVRVFFVAGSATLPDLPAGFWAGFPNNAVPAGAPWQPIAPHRTIPSVDSGRSAIVGFEWTVPATVGSAVALLAVVSADNDPLVASAREVPDVIRNTRQCALRNIAVVNPSPVVGPQSHALVLDLLPAAAAFLTLDAEARALVRGVVVSRALGAAARKAGWKPIEPTADDVASLTQAIDARPELRTLLDRRTAYAQPARAGGIDLSALAAGEPTPIVLMLRRSPPRGTGSLVVRQPGDAPLGGLTIVNLAGGAS